ncbi:MAG TPA: hypothetical protein VK146_07905 [Tabrizicola sp.]|nr:hypothetical protein [Tabrizicola sp.]
MTGRSASDLIRDEAELLSVGMKLQNEGLQLLLAEMRALASLLPGETPHLPTDAEIEDGFDNMPL